MVIYRTMSDTKVSVIMPTYNEGSYIKQAVESILESIYENIELIIIDDGSSDKTLDIVHSYSDDRLSIVERTNESGVTSARNKGIKLASGDYISVHDADDWSDPERFERQIAYLDEHPEVALVGTGAYLVDEDGDAQSRRRVLETPSLDDLIEHNEFVHGSVMMRRDVLQEIGGYDEWFPVAEDYDLWLRLADEYEVRNIDEPLYYFRQHDDSLYGSNLEELKLYHLLAVRKVQSGLDADLKRKIDEHGIETFADRLTTDERRWFHAELAKENLRYGNLRKGRRHARGLRAVDRTNPLSYVLYALSYTTPRVTKFAARTYRRLRNWSLARGNA